MTIAESAPIGFADPPTAGLALVSSDRVPPLADSAARRRDRERSSALRFVVAAVTAELVATSDAGLSARTLRMNAAKAVQDLAPSVQLDALPQVAALLVRARLQRNIVVRSLI